MATKKDHSQNSQIDNNLKFGNQAIMAHST